MKLKKLLCSALCSIMVLSGYCIPVYAYESEGIVTESEGVNEDPTNESTTEEDLQVTKENEETDAEETKSEKEVVLETEKVYEDFNGNKIILKVQDSWSDAYNVSATIENNTDKTLENWAIFMEMDQEITNIWNGVIDERTGNRYVIKNATWNMNILPGSSQSFGYTVSGAFNGLPRNCSIFGNKTEKAEEIEAKYILYSDWGSGFNAAIEVTNNS